MSSSKRPLVADSIPLFNLLGHRLVSMVNDYEQPTIIRASVAKARAVLNKYYNLSDDSKMYRLCMSSFLSLYICSMLTVS